MSFFYAPIILLWRHRRLLWRTVRSDMRARYAGSALGLAWMALYPLLFLALYTSALSARTGMAAGPAKAIFVFCGLIPFLGFAESLAGGTASVTSNAQLIKNTLYPIELIPVKSVIVAQGTCIVGTLVLLVGVGVVGKLTWYAPLVIVVWLLQLLLTVGVVWIFACVNTFLRDLQNTVSILILMLMIASPIAYTIDEVPEKMRVILAFNPLYYTITSYQDCLYLGRFPRTLWALALLSVGTFLVGAWFFRRLKTVLADNV